MAPNASQSKVCKVCKQDCSAVARVKDRYGHYVCQACVDAARRSPASNPVEQSPPASGNDEGIIPIDFDGVSLPSTDELCPGCSMPLSSNSVVCLGCGFNRRTGRFTADDLNAAQNPERAAKTKRYSCVKCGYSLDGLKTPRCPECGTINTRETGKLDRAQMSRTIVRDAYLQPAIIGAVGVVGLLILMVATGAPMAFVAVSIMLAIGAIIGTVVYFFFCLMWSGFDMPMHMAAIRLFAVFSISTFVELLSAQFLIFPVAMVISTLTYYGFLMKLMELDDWKDAILLTFVMRVAGLVSLYTAWVLISKL